MKSIQTDTSRGRHTSDSRQSKPQGSKSVFPYASVERTNALIAAGAAIRTKRLQASDMVSTDEAAAIVGTSRVTINAWIKAGRCIGLVRTTRGLRVPSWQFAAPLWSAVPLLAQALGTTDGWSLLEFLEQPCEALGGMPPRHAIEQGLIEKVLAIAEREGN